MSIKTRLDRVEQHARARAVEADPAFDNLLNWCSVHELIIMSDHLDARQGNDWTFADRCIFEILLSAQQRRQNYGSVEAWEASNSA